MFQREFDYHNLFQKSLFISNFRPSGRKFEIKSDFWLGRKFEIKSNFWNKMQIEIKSDFWNKLQIDLA